MSVNHSTIERTLTLRVLVVDDDHDCADSTGELLRCWGCVVRVAYEGEDGLAAAAVFRPDVILLDLAMPRLSGYECVRSLYAQGGPRTVVFAITGYGDEAHRTQALFAGFDEYLVKPVDPQELLRLLRLEQTMKAKVGEGVVARNWTLETETSAASENCVSNVCVR